MIKPFHGLAMVAVIALVGCQESKTSTTSTGSTTSTTTTASPAAPAPATTVGAPSTAKEVTMPDGLKYQDMTVGDGALAESGSRVKVHYTGWLTDGTKFDSSHDHGAAFEFPIGKGHVIAGWDEGVASMKVGGKRKLTIPSALGYGEQGTPGGPIPPNAMLVFDVELVGVQ